MVVIQMHTLAILLLDLKREAEELLRLLQNTVAEAGGHPVVDDLEEAVVPTCVAHLDDQLGFSAGVGGVERCNH